MEQTTAVPEFTDAARQIRSLWAESEQRGAPMVSAESMQARLFAIYDEAARVCECPPGTVRSRVARARAALVELVRQSERDHSQRRSSSA